MESRVEPASGKLNLIQIRVNQRLTTGEVIAILRRDPPHIVQQKIKKGVNPRLLFMFYFSACDLEAITGQMIFFRDRIEVQVREDCQYRDLGEDLKLLLDSLVRDGSAELEGTYRAGRRY